MNKSKWWKEAVMYQIYPRSFMDSDNDGIGDIKGIIEMIPYIKSLGVDAVWLSPVYSSPNDDNGYDISNYFDIMPQFGTMTDWENLLDGLHRSGIRLIMDLVVNHTSDEHPWFIDAKSSKDSKYRDYYIWKKGDGHLPPNNWVSFFGGTAWEYDQKSEEYYLHLFSQKQPDLNWENPKLRNDIYEMMNWWLDKGIDGFRMDVINLLSKTEGLPCVGDKNVLAWGGQYFINGPKMKDYLDEMFDRVLKDRDIMTVGEMPGVDVKHAILYAGLDKERLNMVFHFESMELDGPKTHPAPFSLKPLKENIVKWQKGLYGKGWNSIYLSNHDQARMVSRFGNDKEYWNESAKLLATLNLTLQGTPYIYQGEEIGMTNVSFDDISQFRDIETINSYNSLIDNGMSKQELLSAWNKRSRDNARTPFQWSPKENAGFTKGKPWIEVNQNYSKINVANQLKDDTSILAYYKRMVKVRKDNPVLIYGGFNDLDVGNDNVFAYTREMGDRLVLVLLCFSSKRESIHLPPQLSNYMLEVIITNYENGKVSDKFNELRPYQAIVLECKRSV